MHRIEDFARTNLRDLISQQLQNKGYAHKGKAGQQRYTITAEKVQTPTDDEVRAANFETAPGLYYLLVINPTFLNINENGDLVRFTVASRGLCVFDTRSPQTELVLYVRDARDFQVGKQAVYINDQPIGPLVPPLSAPAQRLAWADLRDLRRWRAAPWEYPRLQDRVRQFHSELLRESFFRYCAERLQAGRTLVLDDDDGRQYEVAGDGVQLDHKGLRFEHGHVAVTRPGTEPLAYDGERVRVTAKPQPSGRLLVGLELMRKDRPMLNLDGLLAPEDKLTQTEWYTPQAVIDPSVNLPLSDALADVRASLQNEARVLGRKIDSTVHSRLGFICSVLVTIVMGATLGVMFRGARVLAAIALAMVPFFSVLIVIVLGQRLVEEEATTRVGPLVIWGGLLAFLVADGVILRLGVRR